MFIFTLNQINPNLLQLGKKNIQTKIEPTSLIQSKKSKSQPKTSGQQRKRYTKEQPKEKNYLKASQLNSGLKSSVQQSGHQHPNYRKSIANKISNAIKYYTHKTNTILPTKTKPRTSTNIQQKPYQPKIPSTSNGKQNGQLRNKSKSQKMSKQSNFNTNTKIQANKNLSSPEN